jgi:hypothetical protein
MATLGSERRRALRAPVHGEAVLHGRRAAIRGQIENLSLSGVLVRAREMVGRGISVEVLLHLPAAGKPAVRAQVVRAERHEDGSRIALRFDRVSADAEDAIEDEVLAALNAAKRRPVLVIDGIEERRLDLADALRARHMTPLTPRTPLEVVEALSNPHQHVEVCLVSCEFGDHHGRELAAFIHEAFPWVRIMYVGRDAAETADDARWAWDDYSNQISIA